MKLLKTILVLMLLLPFAVQAQTASDRYSKLYNDGVKEIGKKDYEKALALFNEAVRLKPDYAEAIFARGQCALMLNKRDAACVDFTRSYELGWKAAKEYLDKYCGKDAPGRTLKPLKPATK